MEVVLIEGEVVAEEMNGAVVRRVEICLAEEVIRLLEAVDLINIQQRVMILDPSIIQVMSTNAGYEMHTINVLENTCKQLGITV